RPEADGRRDPAGRDRQRPRARGGRGARPRGARRRLIVDERAGAARAAPGLRRPVCLDLLRLAVDRRRLGAAAADRDLDLPRLRLLRLRDVHLEDAVLVLGRDGLLADALRQSDRAREGAEPALVPEVPAVLDLLIALALGGHGQRAVVEL